MRRIDIYLRRGQPPRVTTNKRRTGDRIPAAKFPPRGRRFKFHDRPIRFQ